jgi:SP family sugar:H+ symporter-like MFS transporter
MGRHSLWWHGMPVYAFPHPSTLTLLQLLLPESPRYLLYRGRTEQAKRALGRLLTRSPDSMEVEIERAEIMTALDADRALGQGSYLGMFLSNQHSSKTDSLSDCFRNTEAKNGLRTWTGIMLQGVRVISLIVFIVQLD